MLIKIGFIIAICSISEVWMQNPGCRHYDFNDLGTVVNFTQCRTDDLFVIASYENTDIVPFRSDSEFYLTNDGFGTTCFRTTQLFNMDEYTEIDSVIFLHSSSNDASVFVDIFISDSTNGVHLVGTVGSSNEWTKFSSKVNLRADYVTVEIRAHTTDDTKLAIEYIYIVNPAKAESYCRRPITTTAAPTDSTETTDLTETADPTETTDLTETSDLTETPNSTSSADATVSTDLTETTDAIDTTDSTETDTKATSYGTTQTPSTTSTLSNKGCVWIALSFTFFFTFFYGNCIDRRYNISKKQ